MDFRRSMGTSKPWTMPKRNPSAAQPQGSNAGPSSKLPKMKASMHRSSSVDAQTARKASITRATSKSPLRNRTPLNKARNFLPSSGANSVSSVRSYGMRESMTPSRRESVRVAVKDTRPLSDKNWQQEKVREIIEFCLSAEYPVVLAPNNFPLNSSGFRKLFEFLMQFLIPEFVMPKLQDMCNELPPLLKKIGYPGLVSKSTFQTIGTQHSWGSTLGILSYLINRARKHINRTNCVEQVVFQNLEDPQEEMSDKLMFEHFVDCHLNFQQGKDDFSEELNSLHEKFMELYDINDDSEALDRKLSRVMADYDVLRSSSVDMDELHKILQGRREDLQKMREFVQMSEARHVNKQKECADLDRNVTLLENAKMALKNSVADLEKFCREEKGIDPEKSSSLEYTVHELERQVALKKKALEEADAVLWKTEQALSKRYSNIDNLCEKFNLGVMELKIENPVALKLDRHKPVDEFRAKLTKLFEEYRNKEKNFRDSCTRSEAELQTLNQILNKKIAEVKKLEAEQKKRQEENESILRKTEEECEMLSSALEKMKEKVSSCSDREKMDLKALEQEMIDAQNELRAKMEEKERRIKEGSEMMRRANTLAIEEHDNRVRERSEAVKLYKEKVRQTIAAILDAKKDVQDFVKGLPKF